MDLHSILATYGPYKKKGEIEQEADPQEHGPSFSQIPDLFFDSILTHYKLSRNEILVIMGLYRSVWCKPNLHKRYGIGPIISYEKWIVELGINQEELHQALQRLEKLNFIETIRSGQFFVRKFFLPELDTHFGQTYDNF